MTIKEYWNLIGQEPFFAKTWGPDFSQACSFPKMLMNLKNFRFTKNSRQNWWCDFFKNSKNPVFVPFLTIFGFFLKRSAVTHNYIWATNTILSFRKKLISISEKTYEQIEGQMERPSFIRPFWLRPESKWGFVPTFCGCLPFLKQFKTFPFYTIFQLRLCR